METRIFALIDAVARIEKRFDSALAMARGVSFREYRLLRSLSEFSGARASRVDLAAAVGLTPSAVTRALKPLEKLGLVTTQKGARDARQSLAHLTPAGETLLLDTHAIVTDVTASIPSLPIDDAGLADFAKGLGVARLPVEAI